MWIFKKIDCGLKVIPLVQPEVLDSGHVAATRGTSFEHRNGHECTDPKFHRHCVGRWRGSASLGFAADGNRIRRRVTGSTKTAVLEAMTELRGKSWAVYSAVGCQSTLHAGAVSPHCLLPLGYEHYGARFPGLRRSRASR